MSNMVKFSSQMDAKVLKAMRRQAAASGCTLSALLTKASVEHLQRTAVRPRMMAAMRKSMRQYRGALDLLAD